MRDEKEDKQTGEKLPSGQGFVEFSNEDLAYFAVRYLNNFEIVPTKGLIVDFSMEDQRALFKRKEKIERWRKIAQEKKDQQKDEEPEDSKPIAVQLSPASSDLKTPLPKNAPEVAEPLASPVPK